MMNKTPKILIDGDACPVKDTIFAVGKAYNLPVVVICSIAHFTRKQDERGQWIFVDSSYQNVDMELVNRAQPGDIAITQDYGLAALLLNKHCIVLHHSGFQYTEDNIEQLLMNRHISAKIRQAGGRTKGPKPITGEHKRQFGQLLEKVVQEVKQE